MATLEEIKAAVKAQKWTKSSFIYALDHMEPTRCWSIIESIVKRPEVEAAFYAASQDADKWRRVSKFTTFRHLS
jgi:hypothetical protein